jgi:hypothetical protein
MGVGDLHQTFEVVLEKWESLTFFYIFTQGCTIAALDRKDKFHCDKLGMCVTFFPVAKHRGHSQWVCWHKMNKDKAVELFATWSRQL